jgi:pimeloyl-ACP methyl ester carboxylesterase
MIQKRLLIYSFLSIFIFGVVWMTPSVNAATLVTGQLPPGTTTWTKAGSPYLATLVQVPVDGTLIIEPGVSVKLNGGFAIITSGTMTVGAAGAEPVIMTSWYDSSVGGDTNNDGADRTPQPGDWCSIGISTNGVLTMENVDIRYGSCTGAYAQVFNLGGQAILDDVRFSFGGFINILAANGSSTITHSDITGSQVGVRYHKGTLVLHDNSIHDNTSAGMTNTSLNHIVVDATNNWWGSDAGPFHATLNPGGLGNNSVGDYITFDPWQHVNPLEDISLCVEKCYSSILFLPGLEASRLYGAGEKLWEPGNNEDVKKLFLDSQGQSVRDDIVTRDAIDTAYLPIKGNIYASFQADLDTWKNNEHLIDDYAVAPYDWRLTLDEVVNGGKKIGDDISYLESTDTPYIITELRRLAATSKSGKVTLIAHSNGGLVAKALTDKLGLEASSLIDKIVFVAVPQSGTPQAVGAILHGYDQGLPVDWFPYKMSPKTARIMANNMPSSYHLLPSQNYFTGEGSGVSTPVIRFDDGVATDNYISKYGNKIDTFEELRNFLHDTDGKVSPDSTDLESPAVINDGLLSYSTSVHDTLDSNWSVPVGIKLYEIAGFGKETLGTIRYWSGKKCTKTTLIGQCATYEPQLEYTPELVMDGDGTVVAPSALALSPTSDVTRWWVNLFNYNEDNFPDRKHASILEVSELRNFVKENILTETTALLPQFLSDAEPPMNSGKRLKFYLHSPLALSAKDQAGNIVSADEQNYPGAQYERFGEVQYISVPAASSPKIILDGESEGSFTLEVQEDVSGVVTSQTTFEAIPTTIDTKVTMNFPDGTLEHAEPLIVDYDGNGIPEFLLDPKPGEVVQLPPVDETPPEAQITFDTVTQNITVVGIDAGGPVSVAYAPAMAEAKKKHKEPKNDVMTATLTDPSGNTSVLTYRVRFPNHDHGAAWELLSMEYNGVVTAVPETVLRYRWLQKKDRYYLFAAYAKTIGQRLETHYRPRQDVTILMTRPEDLNDEDDDSRIDMRPTRERLPGWVVPYLETKEGKVNIKY